MTIVLTFSLFIMVGSRLKNSVEVNSSFIYVPDDYEKIQWAINNASVGSTIFVRSATYHEHIRIDKPLTLQGENRETIIDGNYTGDVIRVVSNNVKISGFTIKNSGLGFWESGIRLYNSNYTNISYNNMINNGHGIWLDGSNYNVLTNNEISNNQCGIGLSFSNNNTIANNNVFLSDECGIGLDYSGNNNITSNVVSKNGYGIWICIAKGNIVFLNDIVNNTYQAHSFNSTNVWDNNQKGNYWSDYEGEDADHDGIGDTPYVININNIDHYPLMEAVVIPEISSNTILFLLEILTLAATMLLKAKSCLRKRHNVPPTSPFLQNREYSIP